MLAYLGWLQADEWCFVSSELEGSQTEDVFACGVLARLSQEFRDAHVHVLGGWRQVSEFLFKQVRAISKHLRKLVCLHLLGGCRQVSGLLF